MAKTTPYPPCTVTSFWLKYLDRDRMLRLVTLTEPYRRAVSKNAAQKIGSAPYLDKFRMTSKLCSTLTEKPTRILLRDSLVIIRKSLYHDRFRRRQFLYLDKLLTHFY